MSRTDVFRDGRVHVMAERCKTCIFHPGNRMRLSKGRVKQMVKSCMGQPGGNIPCHDTLDQDHQAICRGYWDGPGQQDSLLAWAIALDIVVYDGMGSNE